MAHYDISYILWFHLVGLHLQNVTFAYPIDFLATIIHDNDKFGYIIDSYSKLRITTTTKLF